MHCLKKPNISKNRDVRFSGEVIYAAVYKKEKIMKESTKNIPIFPSDARVCFVGDSLTSCSWSEYVYEYYLEKLPGTKLRMYNAGIGSATINFIMNYLEEDVFVWNPTHVVIMFGANDLNHYPGNDDDRAKAFENDMQKLADVFVKRNITVYFAVEPHYKNDGNKSDIYHKVTMSLAQKMDTGVCDFYTLFDPFMEKYHDIVIQEDQTHFTQIGEAVIARLFLYSQGFDIDITDDQAMLKRIDMTYYGDRKNIFDRKLRAMWFAEALILIAVIGDSVENKLKRLYNRIPTRANGAWGDLEFYRAIDYIEIRPNMDLYISQVESAIDLMIEEASKKSSL